VVFGSWVAAAQSMNVLCSCLVACMLPTLSWCANRADASALGGGVRRVFVTRISVTAVVASPEAPDALCQERASARSLGGRYRAFVSDEQLCAADRLTHFSGDYVLLDGTVVAHGWTSLLGSPLLHPIDLTEEGHRLSLEEDGDVAWSAVCQGTCRPDRTAFLYCFEQ
jgi:hypothetical protein